VSKTLLSGLKEKMKKIFNQKSPPELPEHKPYIDFSGNKCCCDLLNLLIEKGFAVVTAAGVIYICMFITCEPVKGYDGCFTWSYSKGCPC
jgi:hypothetical protein